MKNENGVVKKIIMGVILILILAIGFIMFPWNIWGRWKIKNKLIDKNQKI